MPLDYSQYMKNAQTRIEQLNLLRSEGLICKSGDFVPSVHYPPITKYPPMTADEVLEGYTLPSDGYLDIYAHFPFCERHCLFCHYPGKVGPQTDEKIRYTGYLKREIEIYLKRFGISRIRPRSILIGGGTPTFLPPELLKDFLSFFCERVDISHNPQFNYDVDPGTIVGKDGIERLKIMREYGVNRLTIGVQSLDDSVLRCMNRPHDAALAIESIHNAKAYGFQLNIEFIYGHPGETIENWAKVIEKAVELPTDEIQLYRLKVLAYGDYQGDIIRHTYPSFEETMTMKQIAIDILKENGWNENLRRVYTKSKRFISHYAYNQCCNLYDQVGFGITGFSSYRDRFALNTQSFEEYYRLIDEGGLPTNRGYIRNAEQQLRWSIVLPLKNMDIKKARFEAMNGVPFDSVFRAKVAQLKSYGLLEETERVVRLTDLGSFIADEVVETFNSDEYKPFPRDQYAEGALNPYRDNTSEDAFGQLTDIQDIYEQIANMEQNGLSDISDVQLKKLLTATGESQEALHAAARGKRAEIFKNLLNIRGVIEISNACVKNCAYCAMRRDNKAIERYSLDADDIKRIARQIRDAGISTVFLQSGQNPHCDDLLGDVIPYIKEELGCEALLCLGEKEEEVYNWYSSLGADSYILKFEASNPELNQAATLSKLDDRLECADWIQKAGMKLGTGNIVGLPGQTIDDIVSDIRLAVSMNPDFVSVAPFIANKGTPFEDMPCGSVELTLNAMAILRLALPKALIPTVSALQYLHDSGQVAGLDAGANVITVNFTPKDSRDKYAIYAEDRFVVGLRHAELTAEKANMRLKLAKPIRAK